MGAQVQVSAGVSQGGPVPSGRAHAHLEEVEDGQDGDKLPRVDAAAAVEVVGDKHALQHLWREVVPQRLAPAAELLQGDGPRAGGVQALERVLGLGEAHVQGGELHDEAAAGRGAGSTEAGGAVSAAGGVAAWRCQRLGSLGQPPRYDTAPTLTSIPGAQV